MRIFIRNLLVVTVIFISSNSYAVKHDISIGVINTAYNVVYYTEGQFAGKFTELNTRLNCILSKIDSEMLLTTYPVARINKMLSAGTLDAGVPFARTSFRDEYGQFLEPIIEISYIILFQPGKENEPPADTKIAVVLGSADSAYTKNQGYQMIDTNSYDQSVKLLEKGRVDGIAVPGPLLATMTVNIDKKYIEKVIGVKPLSFYVSKESEHSKDTVNILSQAISSCK